MAQYTPPISIRSDQYQTDEKLKIRIALHTRFGTNPQPWTDWIRRQLPLFPACRVFDLGCGSGELWYADTPAPPPGMRLLLADRSMGMLGSARTALEGRGLPYLCCDALSLPCPEAAFDLVLANHLLFHLPDIPAALREIRRVLRPGGYLCATTYGQDNMAEMFDLLAEAGITFAGGASDPRLAHRRFTFENGAELLQQVFGSSRLVTFPADLAVTEPGPLLAYIGTLFVLTPAQQAALRESIETAIREQGSFFIRKSQGMLLASKDAA
ncbi:MAG: class I SAM-dependent methyltransferase [Anaerolineae bacterium]|nr:class I SAM-dependent methyltransferase [Anaerolineae bacterium]